MALLSHGLIVSRCLGPLALVVVGLLTPSFATGVDRESFALNLRGGSSRGQSEAEEARRKKHGVDVYYMIEMLDKFRTYSVEHQALTDHSHLLEQERLEQDMESTDNSVDKALLEGSATRNEESRLETQNSFNEMINFVSTLKQAMGAKGNAPTCEELTCGMHSKCETTVEKGALCKCEDGYEGDGFLCKPPTQFTASRLILRENPPVQVADLHMTVFMQDRIAVVFRDISQGEKGYFMLGRMTAPGEVEWNKPRHFSNMSKAYSPVVAGLPNGRVCIAYRDNDKEAAGFVLGAEVNHKENKMYFGKQQAFARHQSHTMSLVALPNSRVAVMFADIDTGNKKAPYGAALLTQIGAGGIPELLGRYRFVNAPVSRFSSAVMTPSTFVVGYRQGEGEGAEPTKGKNEASVIWAQMRGSELVFDPHPLSLEPEKGEIWSRGVALVAKDTFAYAYYSGNEQVSKQAIIKVDPGTHAMTVLDGPKTVAKGQTAFIGTISMPFAPRAPHTFTYYSRVGSGYARAQTCNVNPMGLQQHCQDINWAGYEMESVTGVGLGHGRLLFAFTDPQGTPYYQFVSLFEEDAPADPMADEGF